MEDSARKVPRQWNYLTSRDFACTWTRGRERKLPRGTGETIRLRLADGGEFQQCTIFSRWPWMWRGALRGSITRVGIFSIAGQTYCVWSVAPTPAYISA